MPEPHVGAKRKFQNKPLYQNNCTFSLVLELFISQINFRIPLLIRHIGYRSKRKKQNGVPSFCAINCYKLFWVVFVIPNISHVNNIPYPKSKKIGFQKHPYLRIISKIIRIRLLIRNVGYRSKRKMQNGVQKTLFSWSHAINCYKLYNRHSIYQDSKLLVPCCQLCWTGFNWFMGRFKRQSNMHNTLDFCLD